MSAVLTVTMNPALDLSTSTAKVEPTHKLRCAPAQVHPGGGGINVARVLTRLGVDALALYPAGGVAGARLGELLEAEGVRRQALPIAGDTRESFTVREEGSGAEFRFVLPGPRLAPAEWQTVLDAAASCQVTSGLAVTSGSLPPGVPDDFHARLGRRLATQGVRLVVDASGPALAAALEAGVYLAKPSLRELGELVGGAPQTRAQQLDACRRIVRDGRARMLALSLGAEGALLVSDSGAWHAPALQVPVASTVGAGDSFLAGLVAALCEGRAPEQALARAIAASAAALLATGTALCRPADVERLLPQVRVEALT